MALASVALLSSDSAASLKPCRLAASVVCSATLQYLLK